MKVEFTLSEANDFIDSIKEQFDIVRVVEPLKQKVVDVKTMKETTDVCVSLWGRCSRCENCTSNRVLLTKGRAMKVEILGDRTFFVISRYMLVEGRELVLETVYDASSDFMLESAQRGVVTQLIKGYNHLLVTDPLTGLYNRRFLDEDFVPSLKCCYEEGLAVNLALLDVDGFKQINDRYGHQAGDALLKDIGGFWKKHFDSREKRREKIVVRYGGDEILIIVCAVEPEEFRQSVQRYYGEMRKVCYLSGGERMPFSVSFGFASSREIGSCWLWNKLFAIADKRMYQEKSSAK